MVPPRILYFPLPVQGHLGPSLPVVRALVERGATVEALSTEPYVAPLVAAGAHVHPYPETLASHTAEISHSPVEVATMLARITERELLGCATDAVREHRPDVVVVDSMAPWGRLAARAAGIPVVTSTSSFFVHAGLSANPSGAAAVLRSVGGGAVALAELVAIRTRLGRRGLDPGGPLTLLSNRGDHTLVYTAKSFQPGAARLSDDVQFVGSTLGDPAGAGGSPYGGRAGRGAAAAGDPLLQRLGDGPIRYVSLGTIYNDRPVFLRACIDALSGDGRAVVISTGSRVDPRVLGPLPPEVHVVPYAPQLALLERAELFVTHAGMNSVSEALWHGVPMIAFPQAADQPVVAQRLRRLGAGRVLRGAEPRAAQIRALARELLCDDVATTAATRIGRELRTGGGAQRAADVILSHHHPGD